jgi:hypothetical protein
MSIFTEMVAAVVVHSSVAAYSHFGVTLEPVQADPPPAAERTVERVTPKKAQRMSSECLVPRAAVVRT